MSELYTSGEPAFSNNRDSVWQAMMDSLATADHTATPAPWKLQSDGMTIRQDIGEDERGKRIAILGLMQAPYEEVDVDNMQLIVEARNVIAPMLGYIATLRSQLAAKERECDELRAANEHLASKVDSLESYIRESD